MIPNSSIPTLEPLFSKIQISFSPVMQRTQTHKHKGPRCTRDRQPGGLLDTGRSQICQVNSNQHARCFFFVQLDRYIYSCFHNHESAQFGTWLLFFQEQQVKKCGFQHLWRPFFPTSNKKSRSARVQKKISTKGTKTLSLQPGTRAKKRWFFWSGFS